MILCIEWNYCFIEYAITFLNFHILKKTLISPQRALAPFMTSSVRNSGTATEATFETRPYKLHKLETPPNSTTSCTRDEALTFYTQMQMIRRMESAASNLYKEKVMKNAESGDLFSFLPFFVFPFTLLYLLLLSQWISNRFVYLLETDVQAGEFSFIVILYWPGLYYVALDLLHSRTFHRLFVDFAICTVAKKLFVLASRELWGHKTLSSLPTETMDGRTSWVAASQVRNI